ncbi:hypothetical protein Egran_06478 [Elaphomyces granulatus]|uniref:Histone-lysine N-methyltransferase SET5 n=1 Tax=Elaphomyces granulatus TaxID=519963 RepID=A0A232LNS5_9EURO|nr:hypothetical protein Egran_06478 [Elaphomyces granulatus]
MDNRQRIWYNESEKKAARPPDYPDRPDLFDEVKWGPYTPEDDIQLAYYVWSLQDAVLGEEQLNNPVHPFPRPDTETEESHKDTHILAQNVYESLNSRPLTHEEWTDNAQIKMEVTYDGMTVAKAWSYEDIFGDKSPISDNGVIEIDGHDVLKARHWTIKRLQEQLENRGLDKRGKSAELRRRLHDDEHQRRHMDNGSLLPRSDLSAWGFPRKDDYMLKLTQSGLLTPLDMYTWAILLSPYNPTYWVSRSYLFYQMGYFDLAIGDAHRARLLCETLTDGRQRNRQPGLYPRIWHSIEQHIMQIPRIKGELAPPVKRLREVNGINYFVPTLRKALHNITSLSLKALQCWHDYEKMEGYLTQRVEMDYRDKSAFERREKRTDMFLYAKMNERIESTSLYYYERFAGRISGRPYPHSKGNVDRSSQAFLDRVNLEVFGENPQLPLKRCEIRNSELEGLGVYAAQEITAGQILYVDEPSIRGHLNVTQRAEGPKQCENCRQSLHHSVDDIRKSNAGEETRDSAVCVCTFNEGEPIAFCTTSFKQNRGGKTCLEIARELYHFRTCGRNWRWLHDAMRLNWNDEPPTHFTHSNEIHGTVLSLLLREVIDITLLRREQTGNPHLLAHEIDELLPLQGEKEWESSQFPFTLAANIIVPFDILRHLGIDIFRDLTFDTWVIQIVLRKLLLSVVPGDERRRGVDDDDKTREGNKKKIPNSSEQHKPGFAMESWEPSFHDLYLFPGFAMFNHACHTEDPKGASEKNDEGASKENAEWAFDTVIPNRIIVWAKTNIAKDEEILIKYSRKKLGVTDALRLLGCESQCQCVQNGSDSQEVSQASSERGRKRTTDGNISEAEGETDSSKRTKTGTPSSYV